MRCDDAREHLFDYADDRLDAYLRRGLDEHLETCDECAAQLEELRGFSRLAAAWRDEPLPPGTSPVARPDPTHSGLRPPGGFLQWLPLAAGVVLALLVLMRAELDVNDSGWRLSFGSQAEMERRLDDRLASFQSEQRLMLGELRVAQLADQEIIARGLVTSTREVRLQELQALSAMFAAEMDRRSRETDDSLRYLVEYQLRDQDEIERLSRDLMQIRYNGENQP
jgi:hypothetical protein